MNFIILGFCTLGLLPCFIAPHYSRDRPAAELGSEPEMPASSPSSTISSCAQMREAVGPAAEMGCEVVSRGSDEVALIC